MELSVLLRCCLLSFMQLTSHANSVFLICCMQYDTNKDGFLEGMEIQQKDQSVSKPRLH